MHALKLILAHVGTPLLALLAAGTTTAALYVARRKHVGAHRSEDGDIVMFLSRPSDVLVWGRKALERGYLGGPLKLKAEAC